MLDNEYERNECFENPENPAPEQDEKIPLWPIERQ